MDDDHGARVLHDQLRWAREAVLGTLDGLSEYDVRRPLTRTGTNLLGLVKHLTISETHYLGALAGRAFPEPVPRFDDPGYRNHQHMWVPETETRAQVLGLYERACAHADVTVTTLPATTPVVVPWWGEDASVTLGAVLGHVVGETYRHAGHADILREHLTDADDAHDWTEHHARVEGSARAAAAHA